MKTKLFLLILLIGITTSINAQRFHGGVLAGINASQVDGDSWGGYYKTGILAGAFVNTEFRNNFGGQLEIKFSGKGSANSPKSPQILKIRLNYIDVPVLATYKPIEQLKIEGGVSFNYLFSAQAYAGEWENLFNWYDKPNKFETAITFGINYSFFESFDINARYSYSMYPVRSKYSTSSLGDGAWFNNVISFALYFQIGNKE